MIRISNLVFRVVGEIPVTAIPQSRIFKLPGANGDSRLQIFPRRDAINRVPTNTENPQGIFLGGEARPRRSGVPSEHGVAEPE